MRKTKVQRGQIYWIEKSPYKTTYGSVQAPGRPGVIVSNDANNTCALTVEIVYLTTAPKKDLPTHCTINCADGQSTALCEQVTTVSTEQIGKYIRTCTKEEMKTIDRCIRISLGLEDKTATEASAESKERRALEEELARAQEREAMLREMYHDLLERIVAR